MKTPWPSLIFSASLCLSGSLAAEPKSFKQFQANQQSGFSEYKVSQKEAFETYKKIIQEEYAAFKKKVGAHWPDERISSAHEWIYYSDDMQQRVAIDFKDMRIEMANADGSALSQEDREKLLKTILQMTYKKAWQNDELAQNIEKRTVQEIPDAVTAEISNEPMMTAAVASFTEDTIGSGVEALTSRLLSLAYESANAGDEILIIEAQKSKYALDESAVPAKASQFIPHVKHYAKEFNLPPALVMAIMETESSFNPMARSPVPAYGLMQIVPTTAGVDASKLIYGQGKVLSPSYLYEPQNNIELGTAYLSVLYHRYLKKIKDPDTRMWCAVAAYNTGSGNVAKAFVGKASMNRAAPKINQHSAEQAYQRMLKQLPYEETRNYLPKVRSRMDKYSGSI